MSSLVSVIIPIFNAENYLSLCIESVINQNYKNIEILLIDDGSKDESLKICQKYSNHNSNIKVFSKKNSGVSDTRNFGLKNSNGKYIVFVDSDDYLEYNYISLMVEAIESDKSDLVIASYNVIGACNIKSDFETLEAMNGIKNKKEILKKLISIEEKNCIYGYIWRCLFKKDIIINNEIFFDKIKMSEDYLFLAEYLNKCHTISVMAKKIYNYRVNNYSVTSKYIDSLLKDMKYVNNRIYKEIIKENIELYANYIGIVCNTYLCYIQNIAKSKKIFNELKLQKINKKVYFKEYLIKRKKYNIRFRKKLKIALVMFDCGLEWLYILMFWLRSKIK